MVYAFTNENVSSFKDIYNFDNAKVLSVLGSGDQYFTSLLYGAENVELFDINGLAWDYFVLKNAAIMHLDYSDFYDYYYGGNDSSRDYYDYIKEYLTKDVRTNLDEIRRNLNLNKYFFLYKHIPKGDGSTIPYLEKENYKRLQTILAKRDLPIFYREDINNLPNIVSGKNYDIVLTSNIFNWQDNSVNEWLKLLEKINFSECQANYIWDQNPNSDSEIKRQFINCGLELEYVFPFFNTSEKKDCVVSLRKIKK